MIGIELSLKKENRLDAQKISERKNKFSVFILSNFRI